MAVLLAGSHSLWTTEDRRRSVVLLLAAFVVALVPPIRRAVDRWGRGLLGFALSAITACSVEAIALPARIVTRSGRDRLTDLPGGRSRWRERHEPAGAPTASAAGQSIPSRSGFAPAHRRSRITVAVGAVAVFIALDLVIGALAPPVPEVAHVGELVVAPAGLRRQPHVELPQVQDPRRKARAFDGDPWAADYYPQLNSVPLRSEVFDGTRLDDRENRYVSTRDGVRVSYVPPSPRPLPQVWIFGGSTAFGEGQRDMHTVASELARIAERDGHPVEVVNLGLRGAVHFQEVLHFEEALAERPAPSLAVFYDGINDVSMARAQPQLGHPMVLGSDHQGVAPAPTDLVDSWRRGSMLALLWRSITATRSARSTVEEVVDEYRRGGDIVDALAREHHVPVVHFIQPAAPPSYRPLAEAVIDELDRPVVDLTGALDGPAGQATYIDPVHTNEDGARMVAEAMYRRLESQIAALRPRD